MRPSFLLMAAYMFLAAPVLHAQTAAACPSTKTLDELMKVMYEEVSGPADKDRTCLRQLLLPDARLIPVGKGKDGAIVTHTLTLDDWIAHVKEGGYKGFFQVQTRSQSEVYGDIAHIWSTYKVWHTAGGKPEVRGINSIQAVFNGTEWKVIEVMWQAETADEPIPQKYLP